MGLFDKLTGKQDQVEDLAKDQLKKHDDQIDATMDKGGDMLGQKVGHDEHIDKGVDMAQGKLDQFSGAEGEPTENA